MQVIETEANSKFHNIENRSSIYDFFLLMKPRVMSLVVFTAFVGMVLSPEKIHPFLMFFSLLSIAIGAGASGAFNQCIDKNIDKIMLRTRQRPIASGKIEVSDALTFASVFSVFSIILLGLSSNWTASFLLAFTIFFYVVIYSLWLKHLTSQNIVIGGAAGAFPPIIGWISTGSDITFTPIFLFLIIFLWTPPHFWALAISIKEDYRKAKVPMLPVVASDKNTRVQILIYSLHLSKRRTFPPNHDCAKNRLLGLVRHSLAAAPYGENLTSFSRRSRVKTPPILLADLLSHKVVSTCTVCNLNV